MVFVTVKFVRFTTETVLLKALDTYALPLLGWTATLLGSVPTVISASLRGEDPETSKAETEFPLGLTLTRRMLSRERAIGLDWSGPTDVCARAAGAPPITRQPKATNPRRARRGHV